MSISKNGQNAARITPPDPDEVTELLMSEEQLWECIGNQPIKNIEALDKARDTIVGAANAILTGAPREPQLERIKQLAGLSIDIRFQQLIRLVVAAVEDGGEGGLEAARRTATLALEMATTLPSWPVNWDDPDYPKHGVWRPKSGRHHGATQQGPGSS